MGSDKEWRKEGEAEGPQEVSSSVATSANARLGHGTTDRAPSDWRLLLPTSCRMTRRHRTHSAIHLQKKTPNFAELNTDVSVSKTVRIAVFELEKRATIAGAETGIEGEFAITAICDYVMTPVGVLFREGSALYAIGAKRRDVPRKRFPMLEPA